MCRARSPIALVILFLALIPTSVTAQYTVEQCSWMLEQITHSIEARSSKQIISLERQNLAFCKEHMQPDEYANHLDTLASSLEDDGQHQDALGVANRCLLIDADYLPCLSKKARALYSLRRFREAKSVIEKSIGLGAITEFDVAAQKQLRKLIVSVNAALSKATPAADDQDAIEPRGSSRKLPAGVSGEVLCGRSVGITIDINGELDATTVESVRKLFEEYHEKQTQWKAGKCDDGVKQKGLDYSGLEGFSINSQGGSVAAAMAIGRMFRRENAWIGVNGVCFSACVFILAGAVDRRIGKSDQVGIHRPYLRSTPEKPIEPDQVKEAYSRMLQDMRSYLREMNVSQRLADDMLATEPENNHILTEAELRAYRLTGVDPAEQQRRAIQKEAADIQEANRLGLDRLEYTRRKSLGEKLCTYSTSGALADGIEYADCKMRILKTGSK